MIITLNICLSDIPKDKIFTAKNGKKYLNCVLSELREPSQYGETHTIYMSQTKEEREAKASKTYIGKGKVYESTQPAHKPTPTSDDDLPY